MKLIKETSDNFKEYYIGDEDERYQNIKILFDKWSRPLLRSWNSTSYKRYKFCIPSYDIETFNYIIELSDDSNEEDKDTQQIQLKIESYYAIRYDINWYIGRLLNIENDLCKIKFLKSDLDTFVWPRTDEISFIKKIYIYFMVRYI